MEQNRYSDRPSNIVLTRLKRIKTKEENKWRERTSGKKKEEGEKKISVRKREQGRAHDTGRLNLPFMTAEGLPHDLLRTVSGESSKSANIPLPSRWMN